LNPAPESQAPTSLSLQPIALGVEGVAAVLGLSPSFVKKLDRTGKLPRPMRFGRRRVWSRIEIERWVEAGAPTREQWEEHNRVPEDVDHVRGPRYPLTSTRTMPRRTTP